MLFSFRGLPTHSTRFKVTCPEALTALRAQPHCSQQSSPDTPVTNARWHRGRRAPRGTTQDGPRADSPRGTPQGTTQDGPRADSPRGTPQGTPQDGPRADSPHGTSRYHSGRAQSRLATRGDRTSPSSAHESLWDLFVNIKCIINAKLQLGLRLT